MAEAGGQQPRPSKARTSDRVSVARDYTTTYYQGVVQDERNFVMEHSRARDRKLSVDEFEKLKVIGSGAFGEVCLCRKRDDPRRTVMAMKTVLKAKMIDQGHVLHVRAERDIMVEARRMGLQGAVGSWIVDLYYTFQDDDHLYFVMEFCPGGDMMTWLIRLDIFAVPIAKFYIAELVQAVQTIHSLGYVHRDLKPDNVLLDRHGHAKLTDFGLCKQIPTTVQAPLPTATAGGGVGASPSTSPQSGTGTPSLQGAGSPAPPPPSHQPQLRQHLDRAALDTTLGSPGYGAPEVVDAERTRRPYGKECDWWSVGIILFEMLAGYPPFSGEQNADINHKIRHFERYLEFPNGEDAIDPQAQDLISKLLCRVDERIGYEAIRAHPFFAGLDWNQLRQMPAPIDINIGTDPADTRNFEPDQLQSNPLQHTGKRQGRHEHRYLFSGFTSKFENPQTKSANHPGGRRGQRTAIPSFDGMS